MPSILSVAIGSFVGLWLGMGVLCSPILVSSSCRRLFDSGPFDHIVFNYVGGMGVFTFIHVVLIFAGALVNYVLRVQISTEPREAAIYGITRGGLRYYSLISSYRAY